MPLGVIPALLAAWESVIRSPLMTKILFQRVLLFCSARVAQRQLSGLYGPLLSRRSIVCLGLGRGPMSIMKFSNDESHRAQTLMPRPP